MSKLRLFLAVDISNAQRDAVAGLVNGLRKGIQFTKANPQWVEPNAMHLTLKFIGGVEESRRAGVEKAVERAVRGVEPFVFDLRGLGVFPSDRQPKVLWLGVKKGAAKMTALAERIDQALTAAGVDRDVREFHPHLTLARVKALRGASEMMHIVKSQQKLADTGTAPCDHVTLYQSDLQPEGAVYTALHRWNLQGEAPA